MTADEIDNSIAQLREVNIPKTEEEKQKIVSCGCEIIQGFLYDKPLEVDEFERKYIYA